MSNLALGTACDVRVLSVALLLSIIAMPLAKAQTYTVRYSFQGYPVDGQSPYSGPVRDAAGNLYGTTYWGGAANGGALYKLDPTGAETVLHSFGAQSTDGYGPGGLTLDSAGNLYGTTEFGGAYRSGTVFKVTPDGTEIVLYSFGATLTDGLNPFAGVILDSAGNLYGTTADGGSLRNGTVFRVDPSGTETVLYSFAGYPSDGATPTGSLVRDAAGNLYGTTSSGGSMNYGVVFKLDATGKETLLHDFVGLADGATPGDLVRDASGNLYGPAGGGVGRCGVVFKVDTTGKLTLLHTFTGHGDGSGPESLTLYKGDLYGTTGYGGAPICNFREGIGCGVVFKLNTSGKLTVLYQLTGGKDGATPVSVLAHDNEDNWYGAAASGGSEGDGVVFKVKP
jgi:uncharacterized repeat protein (TIGR03803 family)